MQLHSLAAQNYSSMVFDNASLTLAGRHQEKGFIQRQKIRICVEVLSYMYFVLLAIIQHRPDNSLEGQEENPEPNTEESITLPRAASLDGKDSTCRAEQPNPVFVLVGVLCHFYFNIAPFIITSLKEVCYTQCVYTIALWHLLEAPLLMPMIL